MHTLDEFLSQEPHGTFHDAHVVVVAHDPTAGSASLAADFCVGDPDASASEERERRRRGRLILKGVRLWRQDDPDPTVAPPSHWLKDEGPLRELTSDVGRALVEEFGAEPYCWYFFFSDTNSFLYWSARDVGFEWEGSARPAA